LTGKQASSLPAKKGRTIWIIAVIALLAISGSYFYYSKVSSTRSTASNSSQAQTEVVRRGNLVVSASGTGTLVANSDATFGFDSSGQVTKLYVKVGDQVQAGQVLAQLDDTLLQMKYQEAQQALKELYSAKSIAEIQKEIATAQDTEASAKDWLEYLISPGVVEAEDNLAAAQQKLADAQAAADSNPSAIADQAVKKAQQLVEYYNDKLTGAWDYYRTTYSVENFGTYENIGSRRHPNQVLVTTIDPVTHEKVPEVNTSEDEIATARNNYAQAKETVSEGQAYLAILNSGVIPDNAVGEQITTLYEAQVAVQDAKDALDKTQLIAPISGTITFMDITIGEQGNTSSAVTISQLAQPYQLDAYIDQSDWNTAKVGNHVNVTFGLIPNETFPATVTLVYPELDTTAESPLVHILVQLDRSISQNLPAGTGASIEVIGGEANNAMLLPTNAVHRTSDGGFAVYIIQNGKRVEQSIEVGLQGTSYVEVKSGITAGTEVATK
jgi:multidrug efflux pump subunit AcrA (membrane-fusion protein)